MFQTEPILFLQALASGWLTWAMATVSSMGDALFYVAVIGGIMLALDLRRGFLLAQVVLWTNLVTDMAKWWFALPRPTDVDAAVIDPRTGAPNQIEWHGRGGPAFLALPDAEAVASFRLQPYRSFGFPSGHVSTTVALWGGLTVVFARRFLLVCTLVAAPLMALSRMYLGRHFLADVLGGAVLGGLLVVAARALLAGRGSAGAAAAADRARIARHAAPPGGRTLAGRGAAHADRARRHRRPPAHRPTAGTQPRLPRYSSPAGCRPRSPGWPRALGRLALGAGSVTSPLSVSSGRRASDCRAATRRSPGSSSGVPTPFLAAVGNGDARPARRSLPCRLRAGEELTSSAARLAGRRRRAPRPRERHRAHDDHRGADQRRGARQVVEEESAPQAREHDLDVADCGGASGALALQAEGEEDLPEQRGRSRPRGAAATRCRAAIRTPAASAGRRPAR